MSKQNDDCQELKNIKYKTMLLGGNNLSETKENMNSIDDFLERERQHNTKLPWSKLDKSIKFTKLNAYADYYIKSNSLSKAEEKQLKELLKESVDKKNLLKATTVIYDKSKELITDITNLNHNKTSKKFILKDNTKRVTTSKQLAPKKPRKTRKIENKDELKDRSKSISPVDKQGIINKIDIV